MNNMNVDVNTIAALPHARSSYCNEVTASDTDISMVGSQYSVFGLSGMGGLGVWGSIESINGGRRGDGVLELS